MEANQNWIERNEDIINRLCGSNKCDVNDFLQWQNIRETMFHGCDKIELDTLKNHNWKFWKDALKEDKFGNPLPYPHYKQSSGNLIHHAYNYFQLRPNASVQDINSIYEFGGGYGSFCRLMYRLGFKGSYIIQDLPALLELQELFLSKIELGVHINRRELVQGDKQVSLIDELKAPLNVDLLVATWSLSEAPVSLRDKVLENVNATNILIAYQEAWGGIDNEEYFTNLTVSKPEYAWITHKIQHLPNSWYMIGTKHKRREDD